MPFGNKVGKTLWADVFKTLWTDVSETSWADDVSLCWLWISEKNVFRGSETLIVLMNLMRIYENQNEINVGLGLTHL